MALLGYIDLVALSVLAGHAAGAALRWRQDRDRRQLWFVPAAAVGLAACAPLAVIGWSQAGDQVGWIPRPGLDLTAFSFFFRNLFYSASVAAALIVLAVLAWAVARREAAFATAIAIIPVAVVWLVSQGPHSYFFPRYLLLTVGAWAILAGIALSRLDVRIAVAALLVIAILGAGDQQEIRSPGAHSWPGYPVGSGGSYLDYAGAAAVIARQVRPGDGIVYQFKGRARPMLIGPGVGYYLGRDLRPGVPIPRELFIRETAAQADVLYAVQCRHPACARARRGGSGSWAGRHHEPGQGRHAGPGRRPETVLPAHVRRARGRPDRVPARANVTPQRLAPGGFWRPCHRSFGQMVLSI